MTSALTKKVEKKSANARKKQHGFSLIEMAIALVIVGGIIYAVTQSGKDQKEVVAIDNESKSIISLINNLSSYYDGSSTGYNGVSNTVAISAGLVPTGLKHNGVDTITHRWLNDITVSSGTINDPNDASSVELISIPGNDTCSTIVKKVSELVDVASVAGTTVKAFNGDLDRGALATACNAANVDITLLTR